MVIDPINTGPIQRCFMRCAFYAGCAGLLGIINSENISDEELSVILAEMTVEINHFVTVSLSSDDSNTIN